MNAGLNLSQILPPGSGEAGVRKPDSPEKVRDAGEQFEALLIGQMLRQVRESGSGWLGSGGDGSGDAATEFAEQHLANVLAHQGGLGLATMISKGLSRK